MAKKAKPLGNAAKTLSREVLVQHAARLARVLRVLRKQDATVTSDTLWQSIQRSWSEKDLLDSLKLFERSKKVDRFKKLLQPLPQAGPDGFFKVDGEEWGTVEALSRKLGVSSTALMKRITSIRSRVGRTWNGIFHTFFAHLDVKNACADLLKRMPLAGPNGFFKVDGEEWGTPRALAIRLKIGVTTILRNRRNLRSYSGKVVEGNVCTFYALSSVKSACANLLKTLPKTDESGFITTSGERWGTERAIARILQLSAATIHKYVEHQPYREGKLHDGRIVRLYALIKVQIACADLLMTMPREGSDGFFVADGEEWGRKSAVVRRLGMSTTTFTRKRSYYQSRMGKTSGGVVCKFYALSSVKSTCANLLKSLPIADDSGFFIADGDRWGTIHAIAQKLELSRERIEKNIDRNMTREGRLRDGRIACFFALSVTKQACDNAL